METKKCSKCGEVKALSEYSKDRHQKDGYRPSCSACKRKYRKSHYKKNRKKDLERSSLWRKNNPERVKLNNRRNYIKNCEERKSYQRKYRNDNADSVKLTKANYRKNNAKKVKLRINTWLKDNPGKTAEYYHRRRARKANADGACTSEQLKARFDYHGNKCVYCDSTENLHADHQIPLSRGGTNFASNMVPACASCNCSKGSKTPEEFLVYQFNIAMEKMING